MPSPAKNLERYINSGDRIGDVYEVEDTIGYGAFGAIFSAIDQNTGERVAIKALPPTTELDSETAHGRFQRELKVIGQLVHENIITLYDFGHTEDDVFYMVLEYVDGVTLDEYVRNQTVSRQTALSLTSQIAEALHHAHQEGVIHRDLKPANIMIVDRRVGPH